MEPGADGSDWGNDLALTGFAEELEVWADQTAYVESTRASEVRLAPQSVIPVGLFGAGQETRTWFRRKKEQPPVALALITGIVEQARLRKNSWTSRPFAWATVATLGASYDIVASAPDLPEGFQPDQVVQGTFWLVATGRVETPM